MQRFFYLNTIVDAGILLLLLGFSSAIFFYHEEDPVLPVPEFLQYHGYQCEIHNVETEDGYILELHRVPHEKRYQNVTTTSKPREVALLVHCLLCTSSIWVMQGPAKSLAFMLADGGYDVWMINSRGTTHSKKHVNLTTESKNYWDFSWHEMANYDIPATIDYILNITNQKQLNYVGYSMGTTQFFALMSHKPEYNSKIRRMIALAPAVYLSHSHGILLYMSTFVHHIEKVASAIRQYEFPSNSQRLRESIHHLCDYRNILLRPSCEKFFILLTGTSNKHLELESLHNYFMYFPDTTSVRTVTHYYQIRNSGKFRLYNFGKKKNQLMYGSSYPPTYNLTKVSAPVYLLYADGDVVTSPEDVEHLKSELPNVVLTYKIKAVGFSHVDFGWGLNVKSLVYDKVLKILNHSAAKKKEEIGTKAEEVN